MEHDIRQASLRAELPEQLLDERAALRRGKVRRDETRRGDVLGCDAGEQTMYSPSLIGDCEQAEEL